MTTLPEKEIDQIKLNILSNEEIKDYAVCEITHTKLEGENSLYDIRMGPMSNELCGTCNEDIWTCPGHFGYIKLHQPIPNPIHKKMILMYLTIFCRNCYKNLMTKERTKLLGLKSVLQISEECKNIQFCPSCNYTVPEFYIIEDRFYVKVDDRKFILSYQEIVKIFENITEEEFTICKLKDPKLHPKNLLISNLLVSPVCCRPYMSVNGEKCHDDRTYKYIDIIKANQKIRETKSDKIRNDFIDALFFHIKTTYDNSQGKAKDVCRKRPLKCIKQRISGKKGLIRGCIQGKRTHFTGRTVITPEVNCMTDEIVLPPEFAEELTFPIKVNEINLKQCYDLLYEDKVKYIIRNDKNFNASYAINTIGFKVDDYDLIKRGGQTFTVWDYEHSKQKKFELRPTDMVIRNGKIQDNVTISTRKKFDLKIGDTIERKLQDGDWVLLNRQPTLWKGSMRAKRVKLLPGKTIRFSLASTAAYNADFDGDEMNIHPAQSYEAKVECEQILSVKANFMSSQDSKPLLSFKQDAMTGGYKLTFGYVKIPKSVFFDCLMIFPDMDIMAKIDHIKEVHRWKGLTQKEMDKISKENPDMNKEELEQIAEDNLFYTGHSLFSFLLPNDFEYNCQNKICPLGNPLEITRGVLLSGTLNKVAIGNSSGSLIHHLFKDYNPQVALDFVSYYQMIINHWLIHHGFSISLEDCVAHKTDMIENEIRNCLLEAEAVMKTEKDPEVSEFRVSNILNKATTLGQKIAKEALDPTNNLVSMIRSGAKGNDFNVTQITGLVGQQCVSAARIPKLFKGRTLPHFCKDTYASSSVDILSMNLEYDVSKIVESRGFVKNSYYRGLTPTEFFFHACGGREGVIDTACKSVVYETELLIMEDGKMKHIKIGEWIDEHMKNSKDIEEEEDEKRELLELENEVYIPTTDLKGNISWGKITAITRHDPTENMYEIKTLSGRDVTVTDSHSLLIWNETKQEFERVKPQFITVGSFVPTTSKLVEPPVIHDYFDNEKIFSKNEYVYGSDFLKAKSMVEKVLEENERMPNGWWKENNGKLFTLPYKTPQLFLRTLVRSNIEHIQENCIYPYSAVRKNIIIKDKFEFNYDNGVYLGLYISEGNACDGYVNITNNEPKILEFISEWYKKHNIKYEITSCKNKIGGTSTCIRGFSTLLSTVITTLAGKGARNKYIHPECLNANKEFIKGLINGIFSGDGYVTKNSVELSSASFRLINDVSICLSRLNIFGKISTYKVNDNNLKTENPADRNILSIRTFWLKNFQKEIKLLSVHKQEKLSSIVPNDFSYQFKLNNDVVLDKIVSIKKVEIKHNKVYDLTVPSTLNFGLYNGLHVVDTAKTGYIQRKMVKILEDIHFNYNNMVVNNFNQILEFSYGDDNMDTSKLIKTNYGYSFIDVEHTTNILNKNNEWDEWNRNKLK